jgi:single-strand DNA-binding protein
MASLNKVTLIGNLGADPDLKYTPSGKPVCNLSVATNETWKDKAGEKQSKVEWHKVQAWGDLAENCAKYLAKGRSVYVEGKLQTRKWQDKDGKDRYTTEIVASQVLFLGGGDGDEAPRGGGERKSAGTHREERWPPSGQQSLSASDDDIPF